MPTMRRSVSMNTTATVLQARLGRYQITLVGVNTLLLVVGISMSFFGLLLISSYHMTRLHFLSNWLYIFPMTISSLGCLTFFLSIMGIMATAAKNRYFLLVYACLMACLVIPQFFSTYAAIRAKEDTDEQGFTKNPQVAALRKHILEAYQSDDHEALATWHLIQEDLRCCGTGTGGSAQGYDFWRNAAGNLSLDLPVSCCVKTDGKASHNCPWKGFFQDSMSRLLNSGQEKDNIKAEIYRTGCLTVLNSIYTDEVVPYLQPFFMLASILVAVLEIAVVAIAIGYVAVLRRREEKYGYAGDNGHNDTPF